jgi:hypothetical protein
MCRSAAGSGRGPAGEDLEVSSTGGIMGPRVRVVAFAQLSADTALALDQAALTVRAGQAAAFLEH